MRRFTLLLMLLACTALLAPQPASASWWSKDDTLVVIDGKRYTSEDFKRWWGFWNDEGLELPKTPDLYIDWLLLAREGERMDLANDPAFQRLTNVFLQSRTLLMLKNDAVNSRIRITDEDLRELYEEHYTPRWQLQQLHFSDEDTAAAAWRELSEGVLTVEELLARDAGEGGPVIRRESWLRPIGIDPAWAAIFRKMTAGEVVDPSEHDGGIVLYHLQDLKGGDEEDFAGRREEVRRNIWKEREHALTLQLISELRRKYEVEVDEERIAALDVNAPEDSFTDAVLISTNRQQMTEQDFMAIARRDMGLRPDAAHAAFDEEEARKLKTRVVDGFIAQSLTNWESLDRRYEEKEPFKWEYDFHVAHRLTSEIEKRLFALEATVTDNDVKRHFEENISRYTQPALVKLHIIDDTQVPVDKIWREVMGGMDFSKALREHLGRPVPGQEVPANHLDPEVKAVVDRLAPGETSQPFTAQESRVIVHLLDFTPERPLPLERAAKAIHTRLVQEKIEEKRQAYLDVLKSRSKIEIRQRRWQAVRKEIGGVR
jgi:hypothetical protein